MRRALLQAGIALAEPSPRRTAATAELAARLGATFYDASYHALALERRGVFVTADERYLQKAAAVGAVRHVRAWRGK